MQQPTEKPLKVYLGKVCDGLWDTVLQLILDGSCPNQSKTLFYLVVDL